MNHPTQNLSTDPTTTGQGWIFSPASCSSASLLVVPPTATTKNNLSKEEHGDFIKILKTSAVSTTDGWLKLNFASCVVRKTRSLGALVQYSICNMVFVNYIYDMVVDTQFHKFHGRPFARVLYVFLMKYVGR